LILGLIPLRLDSVTRSLDRGLIALKTDLGQGPAWIWAPWMDGLELSFLSVSRPSLIQWQCVRRTYLCNCLSFAALSFIIFLLALAKILHSSSSSWWW
jgi:hypothetical protein